MSLMLQEAHEAPEIVLRQLATNRALLGGVAKRFERRSPRFIAMSARGSSGNAAVYAKYLIETRLGLPVMSSAPSIGSLYRASVDLRDSLTLCISQSGASFDLVENVRWARRQGAWVVSLLNTADSPLAEASDVVIPLGAGTEKSVAATKSHIASLSAILQLVACFTGDRQLLRLLDALPDQLEQAKRLDWSGATEPLSTARELYVAGRGLGLSAALEAALKFKETCALHAEGLSAAELMHGPISLVGAHYPVVLFGQSDETMKSTEDVAERLRATGATVITAGLSDSVAHRAGLDISLPVVPGVHATVAPLTLVQTCYGLADLVSRQRGLDPDKPAHLNKITRTQ